MVTYLISCSILFLFVLLIIKDSVFIHYCFYENGDIELTSEKNSTISFWNLILILALCFIPIINIIFLIGIIILYISYQIDYIYINKKVYDGTLGYVLLKGRNFITKAVAFLIKQSSYALIKTYHSMKKIWAKIDKFMSKPVF